MQVNLIHQNTAPLSRGLMLLLATSTGIAVANIYYAQPLLHSIAQQFSLSYASAGIIVTVAQLSYALGLILLVPLGDLLDQKKLIVLMTGLATVGLLICGLSNHFLWLLVGTAISGFFSVVAQVIVPMSSALAHPEQRGKAVGTIMSGLLLGILLARTVSGTLSTIGNWQTIYWFAAALMAIVTVSLYIKLPSLYQHAGLSYPRLLASIFVLFKQHPILFWRSFMGSLIFACFTLMWTPLAFLLAAAPFHYSDAIIGLFGLAGAIGAVATLQAGKLVDRGKSKQATTFGLVFLTLSWIPLYFAQTSILALVLGIIVLDMCVQLVHVSNQNTIYQLQPNARNRLNAGYMLMYFMGGSIGSLVAGSVYQHYQWQGVCIIGILFGFCALLIWYKTSHLKTNL